MTARAPHHDLLHFGHSNWLDDRLGQAMQDLEELQAAGID